MWRRGGGLTPHTTQSHVRRGSKVTAGSGAGSTRAIAAMAGPGAGAGAGARMGASSSSHFAKNRVASAPVEVLSASKASRRSPEHFSDSRLNWSRHEASQVTGGLALPARGRVWGVEEVWMAGGSGAKDAGGCRSERQQPQRHRCCPTARTQLHGVQQALQGGAGADLELDQVLVRQAGRQRHDLRVRGSRGLPAHGDSQVGLRGEAGR